jgi:hypothetical protein
VRAEQEREKWQRGKAGTRGCGKRRGKKSTGTSITAYPRRRRWWWWSRRPPLPPPPPGAPPPAEAPAAPAAPAAAFESCMLRMRTERGVGLRPPENGTGVCSPLVLARPPPLPGRGSLGPRRPNQTSCGC